MNFEIKYLSEENSKEWDAFCLKNESAWFWHTTVCLEYALKYKPDLKSRSFSFFVTDDAGIAAVCPLIMEESVKPWGTGKEFSSWGLGGYGVVPALRDDLGDKQKEKLLKHIFTYIDGLAAENGVRKAFFRMTPLSAQRPEYNYLMRFGFLDASLNTQIIDLATAAEELEKDVRKGHWYDIRRGEKAYEIEIYDKNKIKKEIFNEYRLLHHKASGRVTRPAETFDLMFGWVKSGNGALVCARNRKGSYAGFALILDYKDGACYASASDDPDDDTGVPLSHCMQWKAVQYLKEKGIKRYEVGYQQFGPQIFDHPLEKDLDISFFKRGFGGRTVTFYRGIKYYDKDYMKKDLEENIKKLTEGD